MAQSVTTAQSGMIGEPFRLRRRYVRLIRYAQLLDPCVRNLHKHSLTIRRDSATLTVSIGWVYLTLRVFAVCVDGTDTQEQREENCERTIR